MSAGVVAWNAALVFGLMTCLWGASVRLRDVSIVDPWWSICFLLVTAHTSLRTGVTPRKALLLSMVGAWAIRLWLHLLVRSRGRPEDPRYQAFRARFGAARYWWVSLFQVFLLQGALALVLSLPLQLAAAAPAPDPIGATDFLGLVTFLLGFAWEAAADAQLAAFQRSPKRPGAVLETGLWRWSRHPNYFGEAVLWFGFWLSSLDRTRGWVGWASIYAPLLMTFLLLRVSGVTLLDAHLTRTRPAYAAYRARTSAFFPWPPRRG